MRKLALILCLASGIAAAQTRAKTDAFEPTHESLIRYGVPRWYEDAKFGIYMHWGPFSVPAYMTEWYPHYMYMEGSPIYRHHIKTWGPLDKFGYKNFIPMLTADKFDPDAFATLFKEAGARYVAAPAVHHDGFAMWDSRQIPFNAKAMGPKRDIVGEIIAAVRRAGLKAGVSTHYGRHWLYYMFRPNYDDWDPKYEGLYGKRRGDNDPPRPEDAEHWKAVMTELIDNYQPDYIFVDGGVIDAEIKFHKPYFRKAMYEVVAHYYNRSRQWNKGVVLTYKRKFMQPDEAVEDFERAGEDHIRKTKWQSDDKVSITGWCYVKDSGFWPVGLLIEHLLDIVSKNGNLLLSIGPKPDGTLREEEVHALHEIGKWLRVNGEAIYGSRPWRIFGEGGEVPYTAPDYTPRNPKTRKMRMGPDAARFTRQGDVLYATVFNWPQNGTFTIRSINTAQPASKAGIKSVMMLGSNEKIRWRLTGQGLDLTFPSKKPCDYAYVFKIVPEGRLLTE
jgi:alpha-L-fucosidase